MSNERAKYADKILTHYITLTMKNAGLPVDGDTYAELDGLITNAVEQAVSVAVTKALRIINESLEGLEAKIQAGEEGGFDL
ncbi:MAG: hypothetical protein ACYTEQ_09535 [Planctomycetota bacterium]|jgi:hypothetical protein